MQTVAPSAAPTLATAEALIAEARAHARRRRRRIALALILLAGMAATAVLITYLVAGAGRAASDRDGHAPLAGPTGVVTGHLAACFGAAPLPGHPLPVSPGTVIVLRGKVTWRPTMPGTWQLIIPKGPVLATEHIQNNYHQTFRFALPPGHYVLLGRYDGVNYPAGTFRTLAEASIAAGKIVRVDLPNACP